MVRGDEVNNKTSEGGYITQAGLCTDEFNCTLKERACENGTVPIGIKPISIFNQVISLSESSKVINQNILQCCDQKM